MANDRGDTPEDLAKRMGHSRLDEGTVMEPGARREVLHTTASVVGESLISYCVFCTYGKLRTLNLQSFAG